MPWLKWLPWRFLIRRVALAHGFLDPVALLAKLHRFAQPSEVAEPVELLRAGVVFHARGLINARVIQHNLDWVWPYWIERQFDPADKAFLPRAFAITHVNLTHRNWTAIGLPDVDELPIVDPRGLLTAHYDSWSLDAWVVSDDGGQLFPCRAEQVIQRWQFNQGLQVVTETTDSSLKLISTASVEVVDGSPVCQLHLNANSDQSGWLVLAVRPYNPEGISFIHQIELNAKRKGWIIEGKPAVVFDMPAERHHISTYRAGDVAIHLQDRQDQTEGLCDVGMITAAAMFRLQPAQQKNLQVHIALPGDSSGQGDAADSWQQALQGCCQLQVPDEKVRYLYRAALHTLVLHSPDDVYPGPYTYKRFWFRDAAFIIHALLCVGLIERAERALDRFPARQTGNGYFHSQQGEWDANGQALWIMQRFCALTNRVPEYGWRQSIVHGARWIGRKRLTKAQDPIHAGLLPAGFSAEHLGPNDFYYWDDFWGIAGLHAAAKLLVLMGDENAALQFQREAEDFQLAVDASLNDCCLRLTRPAMPAAPDRRLDAGAIGSLALGYPLQLCPPKDPRLLDTVEFLLKNCQVGGGFFQDMIHAGINPYLTLHIAQILLRAGDPRHLQLFDAVAAFASSTGQWPEAIHPLTGGGCMGDGQHVWAAAEWLMMVRHYFIREEGEQLIIGEGLPARWLESGQLLNFGPAPTAFGSLTVQLKPAADAIEVEWNASWHKAAPAIEIRIQGYSAVAVQAGEVKVTVCRNTQ